MCALKWSEMAENNSWAFSICSWAKEAFNVTTLLYAGPHEATVNINLVAICVQDTAWQVTQRHPFLYHFHMRWNTSTCSRESNSQFSFWQKWGSDYWILDCHRLKTLRCQGQPQLWQAFRFSMFCPLLRLHSHFLNHLKVSSQDCVSGPLLISWPSSAILIFPSSES